jgi:uncharacterized protein YpmB
MAETNRFNLLRFFSITSLMLIVVIGAAIIYISRQMLVQQLVESGESANVALAKSLANAMWSDHADYVMNVREIDGNALRGKPETAMIHQDVAELVRNIPVLKVKIYNTAATTIYSSEASQIGESKIGNAGFMFSLENGEPASKLSRRGSFSAFSGQVSNVSLVETYVPIFDKNNQQIESVFELYSDVSVLTSRIDETILRMIYALAGLFLLLYLALFYAIRVANKTIHKQNAELDRHQENLESTNLAMLKEIAARKKAEKELEQSRAGEDGTRVLPAVNQMCSDISQVFLNLAGIDRIDDVKQVFKIWKSNKTHGPSSLNIFISLLSQKLAAEERAEFEVSARKCIHL